MSYKVNWGFDLTEEQIKQICQSPVEWRDVCFARLTQHKSNFFDNQKNEYFFGERFYAFFWLNNPQVGQDIQQPFWNSDVRMKRLVNYWVEIGKRLGLKLEGTEWGRDKTNYVLWFSFPTDFLKAKYQSEKIKVLQLHLFFLRLLVERNGTVANIIKYRTTIKRKFPQISITTVVIGMEALWSNLNLRLFTAKWIAHHAYAKSGHFLFARVGGRVPRLVEASIQPNVLKEIQKNKVSYFDAALYERGLEYGGKELFFNNVRSVILAFKKVADEITTL
jgi:hypothetical protein